MDLLDYAKLGAETIINKYTPEELPPQGQFLYHHGVFLSGLEHIYALTGEKRYADYIKAWVDQYVQPDGSLTGSKLDQFDFMQPGILLFRLYDETREPRYKTVLDAIAQVTARWPTSAKGAFWHKYYRENQMWLDTLYMIGPFCALYARAFDQPYFLDRILAQARLMRLHMTDPRTGLLRHGWDDSRVQEWADPETGLSAECWGRAIGWYAVGLTDILALTPPAHPGRPELVNAVRDIANALLRFQDPDTGLWYQVVDKGHDPGNWLETSCSCLFTRAIAKAVNLGVLHPAYLRPARRAADAITARLAIEPAGGNPAGGNPATLTLSKICVGTNVGDYDFYIHRPTSQNDLHGMGAFLLMCAELLAAPAPAAPGPPASA